MSLPPGRGILRGTLPVDLLDELEVEAERRGLATEELVDELLIEWVPRVLAEETEAHLRASLDMARASKEAVR